MATATKPQPAAPKAVRRTAKSAAISFHVYEDNAGDYRWSLLNASGESLGQSEPFTSPAAARTAADLVRSAAGTAEVSSSSEE
jgi:uncharacterized protein YegP (UPF0339 family)